MDRYREKMKQSKSKEKISLKKTIVEHPIGVIKVWLGKIALLLRGKQKVGVEINIVTIAYNLLRIYNIDGYDKLKEKIASYRWKMVLI